MRKAISLFMLSICLLSFAGCQGTAKKDMSNRIVVESGGEFPEFLAGNWKADNSIWQIEFGNDGRILSLVYVMWNEKIDLKQGYFYVDGPNEGTYAYFILGPCEGSYDPNTRQLKVKLTMKEYELRIPDASLRGRSEDYIEGIISEDGTKWEVEWRGYGYLDGASPPDVNYINANPEKMVFTKVDDK